MRIAWIIALLAVGCQSSLVSRSLGARCDVSSECDDRCLAPGTDYPGGFCTLTCDSDDDCPIDANCIEDQGGVCLYTCGDDPGCAFLGDGWTCQQEMDHGGSGQAMVCHG